MIADRNTIEAAWQRRAAEIEARSKRQLAGSVAHYARHPDQIEHRLAELDGEWSAERRMQANAAGIALGSLLLGPLITIFRPVKYVALGFLLQQAVAGASPPLRMLRRLGFRTNREIEQERMALKALRGDFGTPAEGDGDLDEKVARALRAAGAE